MLGLTLSSSSDTLSTLICGSYKVEIFNSLGTFISSTQMDWVDCPLGITPSHDNIKCFGDSTGKLKRIAHSGVSPYTYEWFYNGTLFSSGINDTVHDNLGVGEYTVIITDSVLCQDSIITTISQPMQIHKELININEINCRGTYTGSVSFLISGGKKYDVNNNYFYYLTLDGDTISFSDTSGSTLNYQNLTSFPNTLNSSADSIMFDSLVAGSYVLHIVDKNLCQMLDTFLLTEPIPYQTFASTSFPLICESDSGYLHIDSVSGGGNISYGFIGSNTDSIYVPAGWYEMYIYDSTYSCIDTVPVRCHAQYEIVVYETLNHLLCYGDSSGMITIDSIVGGNAPYEMQWGGIDLSSLIAGTYLVLVIDDIGCVHEEIFEINQPNQFQANSTLYSPSCNGMSDGSIVINPSGGVGQLSWNWLNSTANIDSLYGLYASEYTLVVLDSLSCTDTIDILLEEAELLEVLFDNYQNPLLSNGGFTTVDVEINGGLGPYNILWNDGSSDLQRVLGAGSYSCQIIDANGCVTNDTLVIIEPDSLEVYLSFNYLPCDSGGSNASISILGGVYPINIIWSTSASDTTNSIDSLFNLSTGTTISVLVTDAVGNSVTAQYVVNTFFLETTLYYDNITHIGSIEVDSTSTGGPFNYQWIKNDTYSTVISVDDSSGILCEGTYYVTITDSSLGCSLTDTLDAKFYLPNGIVDLTTTSVLDVSNLWGHGSTYYYLWSSGEITQQSTTICPGEQHFVEVTDSIFGCTVDSIFSIDPILITLDPVEAIIECNLENLDVDMEAIPEGGTPPYSYSWNGPNQFNSTENPLIVSLSPGDYIINVIDNNNCIQDTTFIIRTMNSECIPDIFTPNNDNSNDTWSLEDTFLYSDSEIKIYGRYGRLIFHSVGYNLPWDGKNREGKDVPDGAYFYAIEIGHGFDPIKGTVTIIR